MSCWLLCENSILRSKLHCFIEACKQNQVEVTERNARFRGMDTVAELSDLTNPCHAYLIAETENTLKIYGDSDAAYSSMIARFGPKYGKLMRLYAELVATEQAESMGYYVEDRTELENGDVLLVVNG